MKTCASERSAKFTLEFHCERSQVSSVQSVVKTWLHFLFNRVDVILRTPKNLELHILKFNAFGDVANFEQVLFHSLNRKMPLVMLLTLVAKLKQVLSHSLNRKMPLAMLLTLVAKLKQVLFHSLNRNIHIR